MGSRASIEGFLEQRTGIFRLIGAPGFAFTRFCSFGFWSSCSPTSFGHATGSASTVTSLLSVVDLAVVKADRNVLVTASKVSVGVSGGRVVMATAGLVLVGVDTATGFGLVSLGITVFWEWIGVVTAALGLATMRFKMIFGWFTLGLFFFSRSLSCLLLTKVNPSSKAVLLSEGHLVFFFLGLRLVAILGLAESSFVSVGGKREVQALSGMVGSKYCALSPFHTTNDNKRTGVGFCRRSMERDCCVFCVPRRDSTGRKRRVGSVVDAEKSLPREPFPLWLTCSLLYSLNPCPS